MAKKKSDEGSDKVAAEGRSFWCFISYRHADNSTKGREWATWLHRELETYDVPRELIGQTNDWGDSVPERIYPVFRDEEELPAYADLSTAIVHALSQSKSLLVICSPASRGSRFVNEEIARFKALGRSGRVCGMVIRGDADILSPSCCLPVPLVRRVAPDATVSQVPEEPLLIDVRDPSGEEEWQDPAARIASLISSGMPPDVASKVSASRETKLQEAKLFIIAWVLGVSYQSLSEADGRRLRAIRRSRYLVIGFWISIVLVGILTTWLGVRAATGIKQQASLSAGNAEKARLAAEKTLQEAKIKEAEAGKARLAALYAEAIGFEQARRWSEAVSLLREASQGGHQSSKVELARLLAEGRGVAADRRAAITLLEDVLSSGNPAAQAPLGRLLLAPDQDAAARVRGIGLLQRCLNEGDRSVRLDLAKALIPNRRADAITLLRDEAQAGVAEACWLLGSLLKEQGGQFLRAGQPPEWYGWMLKAADAGWIPAKRDAGCAVFDGTMGPVSSFSSDERRAALRRLIDASFGGEKDASACLKSIYENPANYPERPEEKQDFLMEGAKAGVAKASFMLAEHFSERAKAPDGPDFQSAMEWYGRARQAGMSEPAMLKQAGLMMRVASASRTAESKRMLSGALAFFRQVSGSGNVEAMLGAAEVVQLLGGPDASAQAEVWLRKAEATGSNKARRALAAWIIRSGKDGREASELLRKGMGLRDAEAALQLGDWMFSHAKGRGQLSKTFEVYAEGAELGSGPCAMKAAAMLRRGQGPGVDLRRAENLELKAAKCGEPHAMLERGRFLLESGDAKVLPEAYAWLSEASSSGKSAESAPHLVKAEETLSVTQRATAAVLRKQIQREIAESKQGQVR